MFFSKFEAKFWWSWHVLKLTCSFFRRFRHAGCICPPEFTGEHCEFLSKNFFIKANSQHQQTTTKGYGSKEGPDSAIAYSILSAFGVAVLAVIVIGRKRSQAHPLHSSLPQPPEGITFNQRIYDNVFSEPGDNARAFSSEKEFHDTLPTLSWKAGLFSDSRSFSELNWSSHNVLYSWNSVAAYKSHGYTINP